MSTLYPRSSLSNPGTRKQNICKNVDFNWLQNMSSTSLGMAFRQGPREWDSCASFVVREKTGTLSKDDDEGYENVIYKYYCQLL